MKNKTNDVAAAVGTQKQFSASPQGSYVKRLQGIPMHNVRTSAGKGEALARSLGILAEALNNEGNAHTVRQEKYGIDAAEKVFNAATDEDRKKLDAIGMLGQYGYQGMVDNPYAIAMLDKLRGQHTAKQIEDGFNAAVNQGQFKASTVQEREKQYEDYKTQELQNLQMPYSNNDAFYKGFNSGQALSTLKQSELYFKEKDEEYNLETYMRMKAEAENIAQEISSKTPDEKKAILQDFVNKAKGFQIKGKYLYATYSHLSDFLKTKGDKEAQYILGETEGFIDGQGKKYKIKDKMPMQSNLLATDIKAVQNWEIEEANTVRELEASSDVNDLRARFAKLTVRQQTALKGSYKTIEDGVINRNTVKQEVKLKDFIAKENKNAQLFQLGLIQEAISNNNTTVLNGSKNTNTTTYRGRDKNGLVKEFPFDEETLNLFAAQEEEKYRTLLNEGKMSTEDYVKNVYNMFNMPQLYKQKEARVRQTANILNSLSLTSAKDSSGHYIIPPQIQNILDARSYAPGEFSVFYGKEVTEKIQQIELFQNLTGDKAQGFDRYMIASEALKDPTFNNLVKQRFDSSAPDNIELKTPATGGMQLVNLFNNEYLHKAYYSMFALAAVSMNTDDAHRIALAAIQDNFIIHNNSPMPKAFFGNAFTSLDVEVLDYLKEKLSSGDKGATITYSPTTDILLVYSVNNSKSEPVSRKQYNEYYVNYYKDRDNTKDIVPYETLIENRNSQKDIYSDGVIIDA